MIRLSLLALAIVGSAAWSSTVTASQISVNPSIALEARSFFASPQSNGQFRGEQWGLTLEADSRWESESGNQRLMFEPYVRLDSQDPRRSYSDVRELSFQHRWGASDLLIGISKVTWGVAESRKVVDVINQFDGLEDIDEGEKLGQPMVRISRRSSLGTLEAYWLPYFRERQFPGVDGRLRPSVSVATSRSVYSDGRNTDSGEFALRFKRTQGAVDFGAHWFHGTDRSPRLAFSNELQRLVPTYVELNQLGLDAQWTSDVLILRAEVVVGDSGGTDFTAWVGGLEYTFFGIANSSYDLGIVVEQTKDTRRFGPSSVSPFDDDLFAGVRLTGNDTQDTEVLVGAVFDRKKDSVQAALEFQRRLTSGQLLEVEVRSFGGSKDPIVSSLRRDDNLTVRLTHYF